MKSSIFYNFVLIILTGFLSYQMLNDFIQQESIDPNALDDDWQEQVLLNLTSKCECHKKEVVLVVKKSNTIVVYLENQIDKTRNVLLNEPINQFKNRQFTCDMYKVLRRGEKQNVLGYSLFGKNKKFYEPLNETAKTVKQLYKDWTMRVYYDNSINKSVICQVECATDDNGSLLNVADFCNVNEIYMTFTDYVEGRRRAVLKSMDATMWRW
jgi:hypothetical protein